MCLFSFGGNTNWIHDRTGKEEQKQHGRFVVAVQESPYYLYVLLRAVRAGAAPKLLKYASFDIDESYMGARQATSVS
jgi:hypothetical protein